MDELLSQLNSKSKELDEIIMYSEKYLKTAPEGILRIVKCRNSEQYYYVEKDSNNSYGQYISKKNDEFIRGLAQKEYIRKLLKKAREQKKSIQNLIDLYNPHAIESIYDKLVMKRKQLIVPYILPENQFVAQWEKVDFEKKDIQVEECSQIITERGEIVRSKSEKILADKLSLMNIPYHYEKPLTIKGYGEIYPDFTVLNKRTRKEYYWEHFGMMDQPLYCEKAIKKIETLQRGGHFIGEEVILTFETSKIPLGMRIIEGLIEKYLV